MKTKTYDRLCEIEWTHSRAIIAAKTFADKTVGDQLDDAAFIIQCVRSAGHHLHDPTINRKEFDNIVKALLLSLFGRDGVAA